MPKGRGAANDPSPRPSASVIWACGEKRGFSAGDETVRPSRLKSPGQTFIRARAQRGKLKFGPGALCASSGQVSPAIKRKQETYAQGSQKRRSVDHGDLITGGRELLVATAAPRGRRRTSPFAGFIPIQSPHGHRLIPVGEPHFAPELRDDLRAIPEGRALAVVAGRLRRRVRRAPQIGVTVPIKAKCLLAPQYSRRWPSR